MEIAAPAHIDEDRDVGDDSEDVVPHADVLYSLWPRPPHFGEVLVGVQSDLDDVIEEGAEGGQGEGRHEHRDEAILNH